MNFRIAIIACFLLIFGIPAQAQWISMKGPVWFEVYSQISSGDTVLVSTDRGLFRSTNSGLNWVKNDSISNTIIYSFAQCGSELYAGGDDGLYLSSDFGTSWDTVAGMGQAFGWSPLAVLGQNVFIGSEGGMYHFTGDGMQWQYTPFPVKDLPLYHTNCIGIMGSDLFLCTANNENSHDGIYKSTDSGVTLDSLPSFNGTANAIYPFGRELFIGADSSVYVSKDTGSSWSRASNVPGSAYVESFWKINSSMFASLSDGRLMRSEDTCRTWKYADSGMNVQNVAAITQSGNKIFAGTFQGLFISTDLGESWTASNQDFQTLEVPVGALTTVGSQVFAGSENEVFECAGNDSNWSTRLRVSNLSNVSGISALAANGTRLFARSVDDIWSSPDKGNTWAQPQETTPDFHDNGFFSDGNIMLSSSVDGVLRSTDSGITWDTTNGLSGIPSTAFTAIGSKLFAAVYGGIAKSTDNGASWNIINSVFKSLWVDGVTSLGSILFANQHGFFRSLDSDVTWIRVDSSIFPQGVLSALVVRSQIFVSPQIGTLYVSNDSGVTWQRTGLNSRISSLASDGNQLFAGTSSGVWRRPLSEMTASSFALEIRGAENDTIAFGQVPVGNTALKTVTPYNSGIEKLTIQPVPEPGNDFATSDLSSEMELDSGESFTFEIYFQPTDTGFHSAELSLTSEAKMVNIFLTGTGFDASNVGNNPSSVSEFSSYPNPLSQSTTISFAPETSGYADISIVNPLGVEIAHLFSGVVGAGNHSFTWNPAGIPDGIYECVVRMNGQMQTLPVVVVR